MELELLKTFLEVRKTQHFGKAARNLGLTQAAVSVRIKQLENMIDSPLFVRFRNNLQLTEAGEKLAVHAVNILGQWEKARQEINLRKAGKQTIRMGATDGFCSVLLGQSLSAIYRGIKGISLRVELDYEDALGYKLKDKKLDLALLYEASNSLEHVSQPVSSVELVLVSSVKGQNLEQAMQQDYVAVEWGSFFDTRFLEMTSKMPNPVMQTTMARFALQYLLDCGGVAFLPYRLVEEHLGSALHMVEGMEVLHQPVYAIYNRMSRHAEALEKIVGIIAANVTPHFSKLDEIVRLVSLVQEPAANAESH